MARNITIGIEDDFFEILDKIATVSSAEVVLVVPKGALLFDDLINLMELKKRTSAAGKNIAILTSDRQGIDFARQAGFPAQNIAVSGGKSDMRHAAESFKTAPMAGPKFTEQFSEHKFSEPIIPESSIAAIPEPLRTPEPFPEPMPPYIPNYQVEGYFENQQAQTSKEAETKEANKFEEYEHDGTRRSRRTLITVFSAAIIILLLLTTIILPQADITIYAKTELLTRDMQVTVNASATAPDINQLIIPGTAVNQSQQFSQNFQSTGVINTGQKATGSVQLYNFTGHLLKLGVSTTTLISGGSTYHFLSDVANIKPTKYFANGTDVDPSSLTPPVAIVADQPGDSYNLPQGSRLEIHNTILGNPSNLLYAQNNNQSISGGTTENINTVSATDLASAKTAIASSVIAASEQQLASSKNLTLIDSGLSLQSPAITFNHAANDQSASFSGTVGGQLVGLAFSSSDLKKLVEQRIALTLDKGAYLVTDQGESITESFTSYTPGAQSAILTVHFSGLVSYKVDTSGLPNKIKGLNVTQIQNIISVDSNIQGADIVLKPFWVRNAPWIVQKVYITTKLSPQQGQSQ